MSQEQKHCHALSMKHSFMDTLQRKNPKSIHRDINILSDALVLKCLLFTSYLGSSPSLIYNWISKLYGSDTIETVSKAYKAVANEIRQHNADYPWCYSDLRSFKRNGSILLPITLLFGPLTDRLESYLRGDMNPFTLEMLLTACEFESRIPIGSDSLSQLAKETYISFDSEMRYCVKQKTITELREILVPLINSFSWNFQEGRHGPGATSELRGDTSLGSKEGKASNDTRSLRFGRLYGQTTVDYPVNNRLCSRWVSVPKNVLTRRSIAAEPIVNQYHQQSVFSEFLPFLKTLGIDLEDQTKNQKLAQMGSISGLFATIDLSSASDSIHKDLVWDLFKGTKLFFPLFYSRTSQVDVDGTKIVLNKFCSMGSACCFPLQCLIFYAIVQLAYRRSGCKLAQWAVYGDDIIVYERAYYETLSILRECGFVVNRSKSFPPWHPYKESCGGEYLNGYTIEPFRLPRNFDGVFGNSPKISQLVDVANDALIHGFRAMRKIIVQELVRRNRQSIYFSQVNSTGPNSLWTLRSELANFSYGLVDWQEDVIPVVINVPRFSKEDRMCDLTSWLKTAYFSSRKYPVTLPIDQITNPRPVVTYVPHTTYVVEGDVIICDME